MAVTAVRVHRRVGKPKARKGFGFFGILLTALSFFVAGYVFSATTEGSRVLRNCVAEITNGGTVDGRPVATCLETVKSTGAYRWVYDSVTNLSQLPFHGVHEKLTATREIAQEHASINRHDRETVRIRLIKTSQ